MTFVASAIAVALRITVDLDDTVTATLQSMTSDPLDMIANVHTLAGQAAIALMAAGLVAIVVRRSVAGLAWIGPMLILGTGAIELLFKLVLVHPGPPPELSRSFWDPLSIHMRTPSTFPSGHVARLTFLAMTAASLRPRRSVAVVAVVFIAATVYLRIYIGDHWLSDTIGGFALGVACAVIAIAWMRSATA